MERYLDPKNDVMFKKIFSEHKDLLISFLNAFMPLMDDQEIISVEYLSPEQVPETRYRKLSIVDVKCIDNYNRSFVVEMQNDWTKTFSNRLLINGAKAIVNQMNKKRIDDPAVDYLALEPVYVLAVVNDEFTEKTKKQWYHHLRLTDPKNPSFEIRGLDYILLELPKFNRDTWRLADKKAAVLWLRFLREINHLTENLPRVLKSDKLIRKALKVCRESALTPAERQAYDDYLDSIMMDNTFKNLEKKVVENEKTIAEKDQALAENAQALAEKDQIIIENAQALAQKDAEIETLRKKLGM